MQSWPDGDSFSRSPLASAGSVRSAKFALAKSERLNEGEVPMTVWDWINALDLYGYADEIRAGLDELERQVAPEGEEKYLIQSNRIGFFYTIGDYPKAREACLLTLYWAEQDDSQYDATHHAIYAYALLCGICWYQKDWDDLAHWAGIGAEVVARSGHRREAAEFQMWQAVIARLKGEERAKLERRQAAEKVQRLGAPPSDLCFEALAAYHEVGGDWEQVAHTRRCELARNEEMAGRDDAVRTRIKICRALVKQGVPVREEVELARQAARRLRDPRAYLEQLAVILREAGGSDSKENHG
jgi:hypothetical protein